MSGADSWNQRYAEGRTGWDLGEVPPIVRREAQARSASAGGPLSVLVPGSGRGHDAIGWAAAGHEVVAMDFAPLALEAAGALASSAGLELELELGDVSAMPADWTDRFDLVWEQTCLCAIPPELREPYLEEVRRVLRPGGELLALLWNHGNDGGPPYDMHEGLVRSLLEPRFELEAPIAIADSPAGREGEWLWRGRPR